MGRVRALNWRASSAITDRSLFRRAARILYFPLALWLYIYAIHTCFYLDVKNVDNRFYLIVKKKYFALLLLTTTR
jgi:hypothetical protein